MKAENGNALFLILIAVALFAALSYAITQSGRGGAGVDKETREIKTAQLMQKLAAFDQAFTRLTAVNGCTEAQISFENPTISGYANSNAPGDERCHMFSADGGGLTYESVPNDILNTSISDPENGNYIFNGQNQLDFSPTGTVAPELAVIVPFIKKEICEKLNQKNQDYTGDPPRSNSSYTIASNKFQGTYNLAVVNNESAYVECVLFRNFNYGTNFSADAYALVYPLKYR